LRHKRSVLLSSILLVFSFIGLTAKKIFDYAAAPVGAKQSDFIFPDSPDQEKQTTRFFQPAPLTISFTQIGGFTNDASHLNKTAVYGVTQPKSEEDVRSILKFASEHKLKVTCAGQQHSMGGQSFTHGGIVLDLADLNGIRVDAQNKTVNVQSGVRWWRLQQVLDAQGLSVKSMQSINIFSVGGTLSVNAHGIDPAPGPIAPTVRKMRVMLSDGSIVETSPSVNPDLFRHVLGGYGLFGVILDVDLDVADNQLYSRKAEYIDYKEFPHFYRMNIEGNPRTGLAFARISVAPQSFLREVAVHMYSTTDYKNSLPPVVPARHNAFARFVINFSKTGGTGRWARWTLEKYIEPYLHTCLSRNQAMSQSENCLVSRNEEMYDDMAYLKNRLPDTDILQEYFVSYEKMPEFIDGLRSVVNRNRANLLNVTIRTVHKDGITALPYAKDNMFAFVLYFNAKFNQKDMAVLRQTTSDLIDAAQRVGGTYYLPYQLAYSREQLRRSYPEVDDFFSAKRRFDPLELFSNMFYEKFGAPGS